MRDMRRRLRFILTACSVYAALAAAVAAMFPREGLNFLGSFAWWLCAIPMGLVACVSLELFGTWSLGRPFWQRMPSWVRVPLLVALIACVAVVAVFVNRLIGHDGPR